jgi:glycosyltransferase involved in cell wall biosynthesis
VAFKELSQSIHKTTSDLFSIIIPSFLGNYKNSATNKPEKFIRCINSVMNQTRDDFELIVVSDGCPLTVELCQEYDLTLISIKKQALWSGNVRNAGIEAVTQKFVLYLDTDDYFGESHLSKLADGICDNYSWFWFNDYVWDKDKFIERECNVMSKGRCGTSNIIHRSDMLVKWGDGYLHDWHFIEQLKRGKFKKVPTPEYYVGHIPSKYDV